MSDLEDWGDYNFDYGNSNKNKQKFKLSSRVLLALGTGVTTTLALGVSAILFLHSQATKSATEGVTTSDSSQRVVKVDKSWYTSKTKYDVLPSISSLSDADAGLDVLYTKEFQVSRSFGTADLKDVLSEFDNLHEKFTPAKVGFKSKTGAELFALRSENLYLVVSYAEGVMAVGSRTADAFADLSSIYGDSNGDLGQSDFSSKYSKNSWDIRYKNSLEIEEDSLNEALE